MSRKSEALKTILKKFGGKCDHNSIDEILEAMGECEFSGGGSGGVSSWNDLTDKPFGEEVVYGDTLTWDGNMEGKTTVEVALDDGMLYLVKVSDVVPTIDDLSNGVTATVSGMGSMEIPAEETMTGDGYINAGNAMFVVSTPNTTVEEIGLTFAETGTYFMSQDGMYISELTINGYTGLEATETVKIPAKYMPTETEVVFTVDKLPSALNASTTEVTCNKSVATLFGAYKDSVLHGIIKCYTEIDNAGNIIKKTEEQAKPYSVGISEDLQLNSTGMMIGFDVHDGLNILRYVLSVAKAENTMVVTRTK